jgi:ATP-dependent RNA helicase RhlE
VHRIGRTGRAGASGVAISLVCEDEEKYLAEIEKLIKRSIDKETADIKAPARKASIHGAREHTQNSTALESNRVKYNSGHEARPRQHTRKPAADPWFDKPYEPAKDNSDHTKMATLTNRKLPVAALLGGLRPNK